MENEIKKLSQTEIYKGVRVHLVTEQILLPNGKETTWELILHPGAAAVIPIDDEGKIIMVKQYRNASNGYTLEIPAGTLDAPDEDPLDCARRELEEETGYYSDNVEFLYNFYSAIGICDELIHIYVARNLIPSKQDLDEDEYIELSRFTLDELVQMILSGEIKDNKTISSLLVYKTKFGL
ncbi:MAG: NUDIX hydrolase [Vallitaleaceae bacterium]|nr:NUDIX hydrolase [Vallitaleaceae bacterium]